MQKTEQPAAPKWIMALSYGSFGLGLAFFLVHAGLLSASGALGQAAILVGAGVGLLGVFAGLIGVFLISANRKLGALLHCAAALVLAVLLVMLAVIAGIQGALRIILYILGCLSCGGYGFVGGRLLLFSSAKPARKAGSPPSPKAVAKKKPEPPQLVPVRNATVLCSEAAMRYSSRASRTSEYRRINTEAILGVAATLLVVICSAAACFVIYQVGLDRQQAAKTAFRSSLAALGDAGNQTAPVNSTPEADRSLEPLV